MSITILRSGLFTTVQDLGRFCFQKYGVPISGAMDSFAHRIANLLVGNREEETTVEITLRGPVIRFEKDSLISVCGANLSPLIDGAPVSLWKPVFIKTGSILRFGTPVEGSRTYLAVAGGFRVPNVMNSKSTYVRAGFGGLEGRTLQKGDILSFGPATHRGAFLIRQLRSKQTTSSFTTANWHISQDLLPAYRQNPVIRAIKGTEFSLFTSESQTKLFSEPFIVTTESDRMGYRLKGPQLQLIEPGELISEGVTHGTVQVSPEGNPIILMSDRQTLGGYPKIAQIISVDFPLLAQVKPGEIIRFQETSLQEAQALCRLHERNMRIVRHAIFIKQR